jgi:hypothetical protein
MDNLFPFEGLPPVFDADKGTATFLSTNGIMSIVDLRTRSVNRFPLFLGDTTKGSTFFGFTASADAFYFGLNTPKRTLDEPLPIYQIPKDVNAPLYFSQDAPFALARCNAKLTGMAFHDRITIPELEVLDNDGEIITLENFETEPGVFTANEEYMSNAVNGGIGFGVNDLIVPFSDERWFSGMPSTVQVQVDAVVKVAFSNNMLYGVTNKYVNVVNIVEAYKRPIENMFARMGKTLVGTFDPQNPQNPTNINITAFYLDSDGFYLAMMYGDPDQPYAATTELQKYTLDGKRVWKQQVGVPINGIIGVLDNKCFVYSPTEIFAIDLPASAVSRGSVQRGLQAAQEGETCDWDCDCENEACGREHNDDTRKVCCPGNKGTYSYFGFDWCKGYDDGEACRHNGQCLSGVCNSENRCGKGTADPVTKCSWDYECANDACGREGDVDEKVCCKTGQYCTPFGFDWCSGYGAGAPCKHDCQCTGDLTCHNDKCTCPAGFNACFDGTCATQCKCPDDKFEYEDSKCTACKDETKDPKSGCLQDVCPMPYGAPPETQVRRLGDKCQFSCGFKDTSENVMWCDSSSFENMRWQDACNPVGRYGTFGRCQKDSGPPPVVVPGEFNPGSVEKGLDTGPNNNPAGTFCEFGEKRCPNNTTKCSAYLELC